MTFSQYHMLRRRESLCNSVPRRYFSQIVDNSGPLDEASFELDDDSDIDLSVATLLHYDSEDPVISALLGCTTVQDVFDVLDDPKSTEKKDYHVQAVLMLWYLQNVFMKVQTQLGSINDVTEAEYVAELKKQDQFKDLLQRILKSVGEMDLDELTCSLLYLSKMDVGIVLDIELSNAE